MPKRIAALIDHFELKLRLCHARAPRLHHLIYGFGKQFIVCVQKYHHFAAARAKPALTADPCPPLP